LRGNASDTHPTNPYGYDSPYHQAQLAGVL